MILITELLDGNNWLVLIIEWSCDNLFISEKTFKQNISHLLSYTSFYELSLLLSNNNILIFYIINYVSSIKFNRYSLSRTNHNKYLICIYLSANVVKRKKIIVEKYEEKANLIDVPYF